MSRFGYQPTANWGQPNATQEDVSWSFNGIQIEAGPSNTALLHRSDTGAKMLVQSDVTHALSFCSAFRSLESHTDTILRHMPQLAPHRESTLQRLQSIRHAGILESSEEAWLRLTGSQNHETDRAPCRIFITTCDRPMALKRLLESFTQSQLPQEVEGIWVIDDSREPQSEQDNGDIISAAGGVFDVPVVHVDTAFRKRFVARLLAHVDAEDEIEWLLDRGAWGTAATYGMARTLAVLLSVGRRAIMLDDDILLESIAPPIATGNLQFDDGRGRESVIYDSIESLQQHALANDVPLLGSLLSSLGTTVGDIVTRHLQGHHALQGMDGDQLTRFGNGASIIMAQCGYWGDTGTASGNWIFYLSQQAIKRVLATPDLTTALKASAAWSGYRNPTITPYGTMSAATGLDNTQLLPPYIPAGRGEDLLFGIMTQRLHPDSGVFNLAASVPHLPIDQRGERGALSSMEVKPGLNLFMDWLGREPADQWGLSPTRRLQGVIEDIHRLTEMESAALENMANQMLASKVMTTLRSCMTHLEHLPEYEELPSTPTWKQFLEETRDDLVAQIQTADRSPLASSGAAWAEDDLSQARTHGRALASTLQIWEGLREAAAGFTP
jgi:hypothetical protein